MSVNRGKDFENIFKKCWKNTFPGSFIDRIPDQTSELKGSENKCDFYCFTHKHFFMVECKTTVENTLNFSKMLQIGRMLEFLEDVTEENIIAGVIIWFQKNKKVIWCPLEECARMIRDGKKSINATKSIAEGYKLIELPTTIKRVNPEFNCSIMLYNKEEV